MASRVNCAGLQKDECLSVGGYVCAWAEATRTCTRPTYASIRREREREQAQAKGGWFVISVVAIAVLLLLLFAIQNAFGLPTFDYVSGNYRTQSAPALAIVSAVIFGTLWALFVLLRRCDYSFACFLRGGEEGYADNAMAYLQERRMRDLVNERRFFQSGELAKMRPPERTADPAVLAATRVAAVRGDGGTGGDLDEGDAFSSLY